VSFRDSALPGFCKKKVCQVFVEIGCQVSWRQVIFGAKSYVFFSRDGIFFGVVMGWQMGELGSKIDPATAVSHATPSLNRACPRIHMASYATKYICVESGVRNGVIQPIVDSGSMIRSDGRQFPMIVRVPREVAWRDCGIAAGRVFV